MTTAQRRASLAWPRDAEREAIAITEEEAMIAGQRALEAAQQEATGEAIAAGE